MRAFLLIIALLALLAFGYKTHVEKTALTRTVDDLRQELATVKEQLKVAQPVSSAPFQPISGTLEPPNRAAGSPHGKYKGGEWMWDSKQTMSRIDDYKPAK